jgi:FixJ family two-component response regulator
MGNSTGADGTRGRQVVYIVDDDNAVRQALTMLLTTVGYRPVAFARPKEFLERLDPGQPACVILDVRMPELSGLEVQQHLNHRGVMAPVILMTGHGDVPMAVQAMKNGAFDFLQKPFKDQDLLDRIDRALKQDTANRAAVEERVDLQRREKSLTEREREILLLLADGKANKVIAIDLSLSERTVEIHRSNVMEKMGAKSIAHLVRMYLALQDRH